MRCEGWTRHGGAFTLGPATWSQCENDGVVLLRVKQDKVETLPACTGCWGKIKEAGIKILSVDPIEGAK